MNTIEILSEIEKLSLLQEVFSSSPIEVQRIASKTYAENTGGVLSKTIVTSLSSKEVKDIAKIMQTSFNTYLTQSHQLFYDIERVMEEAPFKTCAKAA